MCGRKTRWQQEIDAGAAAHEERRDREAESQWKTALRDAEAFGPQDSRLAVSLDDLGELYWDEHRYSESEPLLRRVLSIRRSTLKKDDPEIVASLNNLAGLYSSEGKYAEAEPLYLEALTANQTLAGAQDPTVATSMTNLAETYRREGKYAQAEPLYREALAIREKAFSPSHPAVAISRKNYASFLREAHRDKEARIIEDQPQAADPQEPARN